MIDTRLSLLLAVAEPYGVKGIMLGGCVEPNYKGTNTAMRRSAHAHCFAKFPKYYGWICVKSSKLEKLLTKDGRPNQLFWHEVSHIYRPSRTQKQCDSWAWKMTREFCKATISS